MFRVRRVFDTVLPINRGAITQVRAILAEQFEDLPAREIDSLEEKLRNPFVYRFRPVLFVAEGSRRDVLGFALLLHEPDLDFAYLDYIAAAKGLTSRGIGGSLYERLRDEAVALGCRGVLFECLPDDPEHEPDEATRRENATRLRFYEGYGARPITGTAYQTPVTPDDPSGVPHLVLDPLGRSEPLPGAWIRKVVRAILERKYAYLCPPEYIDRVVRSFDSPHVVLRPFRYRRASPAPTPRRRPLEPIPMIVNDRHEIHHVRERGYVEAPVRLQRILRELDPTGWFRRQPPRRHARARLEEVHSADLVTYLRRASREVGDRKSLYPYVFPVRNRARLPRERSVLAGYYCIDTFTPIHRNSYLAAKRAADCALTAADLLLAGDRLTYALVRPPGHHAERDCFGGFCYFNNAALAAQRLSAHGRVAILDIDYHHGNGQQDIFYRRADVFTVSIHAHPRFAYPYFTGFEDETGEAAGAGANLNLPLPEAVDGRRHRRALRRALEAISDFAPDFLVLALGLDPAKGDPTGTWSLGAADFEANGALIRDSGLPVAVVQEGGYRTRTLGVSARSFWKGLAGV